MAKKMTHFLKIFGITFGAFVGAIGVYLGIVWLITGFKPEVIELTGLKFSQEEYFFSDKDENGNDVESITVMVLSEPEDTTQKQVTLSFLNGMGSDVVSLPIADGETTCVVNVNEPISLNLNRNEEGQVVGGRVTLKAIGVEKDDKMATCNIYLDKPISTFDVDVKKDGALLVTGETELASKIYPGYTMNIGIATEKVGNDGTEKEKVLPEGSRQPFNDIYKEQVANKVKEENLIRNDPKKVFWESTDTTRATVDSDGNIQILPTAAPGTVKIIGRIYRTYELQDSHKTLFDFEYDVTIDPLDVQSEYEKYLERITATCEVTLKILDMDVDHISARETSTSGFHYTVEVNTKKRFYLDGDNENSLGITIDPADSVTDSFTSADLRYKLSRIFVAGSMTKNGIIDYTNGNDCLIVSTIAGSLDTGFYFDVTATYPQNLSENGTCLVIGLGVWDDETQSLKKSPDGRYVLDTTIDGIEINYLTIFLEITTKEATGLAVASSVEKYDSLARIGNQNITADIGETVALDAYLEYENNDGMRVVKTGQAGIITNEVTYGMVAFFVPAGTSMVEYDKSYGDYTYCIDLGQKWYPIGIAPITDAYNSNVLKSNSTLQFKAIGELNVIAVIIRTDINGRVILVDENHQRPVDEEGRLITAEQYEEYAEKMQLYYDFTIKSGDGTGNNFIVKVTENFDISKLTISQKYGENEYEVLSAQSGNLNQVYINDGSTEDYVYLWVHYDEEGLSNEERGIISSAYTLGNFTLESSDVFAIGEQGLTSDGEKFDNTSGTDVLYRMVKMGTTSQPTTVVFRLNGEVVFSYNVSITNKLVEKLYMTTNAIVTDSTVDDCEKITVTVSPSDQNTNASWSVLSYNQETSSTTSLPLEISSYFSYLGAEENLEPINENYDLVVNYSIATEFDGQYGYSIIRGGKPIAVLTNSNRYYLTSKSQPDNDYYGTISFYSSGRIFLKATISPYGDEIRSEKIYEIEIVVDEENWQFNKKFSTDREYLILDMPIINNSTVTGESQYAKIDLDTHVGGISGTYAQLYDTDPTPSTRNVTTLLVDLSRFVSVSYNGTLLRLSANVEHTKFLNFEVMSYNVFSPTTNTYDISKTADYNKAEIFYDEESEVYYLRVKAINYNTRITLKVSTYFGISDTYTILVNAPLTSEITTQYNALRREYVAESITFDLLTRVNISTNNYIYSNGWVGDADMTNDTFKNYIVDMLVNTGVANKTNNNDNTVYIETNRTTISVVKDIDSKQMLEFNLNMAFDLDPSTDNGTQNLQENEWVTYYYVELKPTSRLETHYTGDIYQYNDSMSYRNLYEGQTYNFDELGYIEWLTLKLDGTDSVMLDNEGNALYENRTDEISLEFETSAYLVLDNGHKMYSSKGDLIASIERNARNYYNVIRIEAGIFDELPPTSTILSALKVESTSVKTENYNIRINPLNIIVTGLTEIKEAYIGTTYNLSDEIVVKSETSTKAGELPREYEIPEIIDNIDNKPTITIDSNGVITITPYMQSYIDADEVEQQRPVYPSGNLNFDVIIKVGKLSKTVRFICGKIEASMNTDRKYVTKDMVSNIDTETQYASMLEGSAMSINDVVILSSTIAGSSNIQFSKFAIAKDDYGYRFILQNNKENVVTPSKLTRQKNGVEEYIYYESQCLVILNTETGNIETTTYLPDNYSLYFEVTCEYNSSYRYTLPVRVNSIIFTSTLENSENITKIKDADGNITIYLLSAVEDESPLGQMSGELITAKSMNFITASADNEDPYNEDGDILLDLTFEIGLLDNVEMSDINSINHVYGYDSNGRKREICQITPLGEITVTPRLADQYEFTLRVMYQFENYTSVHDICSYKIVILPEYSLVQKNEETSYTLDNPYEVSLADTTSIDLMSAGDGGVLLLRHVRYDSRKILLGSNGVAYENVESVSATILTTSFSYSLVDENDPNRDIVAFECQLDGNILRLPVSIASDILIEILATVTITDSQTTEYRYYFLIKAGVEFDLKLNPNQSQLIDDTRYYNVTTDRIEGNDLRTLVMLFSDVFSLEGDTRNIDSYSIRIDNVYLYGNDLTSEGITREDNVIKLKDGNVTLSTINYISGENKRLTTNYAMQKEVYMKLTILVNYRSGQISFELNLRLMPKVIVSSLAQNTNIPVIAGTRFKFNNYVTITELNSTTYTYNSMSQDNLDEFSSNIKFNVDHSVNDYLFDGQYDTEVSLGDTIIKPVEIILMDENNGRRTLFTYNLNIYPKYKIEVDSTVTNSQDEVVLFEGQTEILPGKYVFVKTVKYNGNVFEQLNGVPVYVIDEDKTNELYIYVPNEYSYYAKSIENTKVYIKTYSDNPIEVIASIPAGTGNITNVVKIRARDIMVTLKDFDNRPVNATNRIVLPAGTSEQHLMKQAQTDDSSLLFYDLYYEQDGVKLLYYNTASTFHKIVITDVSSDRDVGNEKYYRVISSDVIQNSEDESIIISFANNNLTVSGRIAEKVEVTAVIYIGDVADNEHILYFTFYPVKMEEKVSLSYITDSGDNLQILAVNGGSTVRLKDYIYLDTRYEINGITKNPEYDFSNRVKYSFPEIAATGKFRQRVSGSSNVLTLICLTDNTKTISISLLEDGGDMKIFLDEKLWDIEMDEMQLTVIAKIGLIQRELKFYISPVAFTYNYAYRSSTGYDYYYHSTYIDYAYHPQAGFDVSNEIDLTDLVQSPINTDVTFEMDRVSMQDTQCEIVKLTSDKTIADPQMNNITQVRNYAKDSEGINYAFLRFNGHYFISFNVGTKDVVINGTTYKVPVINETLNIYLIMKKDDIVRSIHIEILPYVQMQKTLTDTYERVDKNGTEDDESDDKVQLYDYYLSGNVYSLNYFYNYNLRSCYKYSDTIMDIRNTTLTRVALGDTNGIQYSVSSYEEVPLNYSDSAKPSKEGNSYSPNFIELTGASQSFIPANSKIKFVNSTLTVDPTLDYVVYLIIRGRATNGYEGLFYLKIIPNVLFINIDDSENGLGNAYANPTTSGEKYDLVKLPDEDADFMENAIVTKAVISNVDTVEGYARITYTALKTTNDGVFDEAINMNLYSFANDYLTSGHEITIAYNINNHEDAIITGYVETLGEITGINGNLISVKYNITTDEGTVEWTSSFVYNDIVGGVGSKILVKYLKDVPSAVKYSGYLNDNTGVFTATNPVETILTGDEYDLKDYLSAYTPSIQSNQIQEYDYNNSEQGVTGKYTDYTDKSLEYNIMYAWYYGSNEDATNPIVLMADIGSNGNVYIDGKEVVTLSDGMLHASSSLIFDVYVNIQGSYKYNARVTYKNSFYLRIVPALKFYICETANTDEHEVTNGKVVLSIETSTDSKIEKLDNGTRIIDLSENYIKAKKILSENGKISINGALVTYSTQVGLSYELKSVAVYTILSNVVKVEGELSSRMLLGQNGLTFEDGLFQLAKTYNTTCDIGLTVTAVIDSVEFSFDVIVQLYRESLIEVDYTDPYDQDETIIYETIVSGADDGTNLRNSINFNANKYLTPYVWSSDKSAYVKTDLTQGVRIVSHSLCKANSPAGQDKTKIQDNIVIFDDLNGTVTARNEIMGDYYFTIQLRLHFNDKDSIYTYYFRLLGRYNLATATLLHTQTDSELHVYNKLIERDRTEEDGTNPIYVTANIMTTNPRNSEGLILIETRTVNAAKAIVITHTLTHMEGLVLDSATVETASGQWASPNPDENQFTFSYEDPSSSSAGIISLAFNDNYYKLRSETKKDLYITLNFNFKYEKGVFSDIYSIQYEILFVPNQK